MALEFNIVNRLPTYEEYAALCASVGWSEVINFQAARKGLQASTAGVVVLNGSDQAIGMGRVVGDGAVYFYIQDVVVTPAYQNQGVGTKILESLFAFIEQNAPEKSFVGLFSVPEALSFYQKFSLEQRDLVGLFTVKELLAS